MSIDLQPQLADELIELVPLKEEDFEILYQVASDPLIWEQHPEKTRFQREVFRKFFDGAVESKGAFLVYDLSSGKVIGSSRYYEWDESKKQLAIGYTFLARSHWGGNYNWSLKQLMINYAFKFADSVVFYVGENNMRSQKALAKIGAKFENKMDNAVMFRIRRSDWVAMQEP